MEYHKLSAVPVYLLSLDTEKLKWSLLPPKGHCRGYSRWILYGRIIGQRAVSDKSQDLANIGLQTLADEVPKFYVSNNMMILSMMVWAKNVTHTVCGFFIFKTNDFTALCPSSSIEMLNLTEYFDNGTNRNKPQLIIHKN